MINNKQTVHAFSTPHRPTKLFIEPATCKSLKILEVASRALASLLITEIGICGNRAENRAATDATLATSLRFPLGERAKKIPTDKGWDFEYWWIWKELHSKGVRVGKDRIQQLMKQHGIKARGKRRYVLTTDSRHNLPIAPNLLDRNFQPEQPNAVWTGDITYIGTDEGWLYLAAVIDLCLLYTSPSPRD